MEIYLVFVDTIQNRNKFWSGKVEDNNLTVQWGRVGYQPQTKVHTLRSYQQAVSKFNNLVTEKKGKGYRESQPQMDGERSIGDIQRAIQLLSYIRPCIANHIYHDGYLTALNEYLKIVPTPLGMQIDYHGIYRSVTDVDYQMELLNSLLTPALQAVQVAVATVAPTEPTVEKVVSLKTISRNFWRNL
jgi:predicted DNA-binding WGR domain protein